MLKKRVFLVVIFVSTVNLLFAQKAPDTNPVQTSKEKIVRPLSTTTFDTVKLVEGKVTSVFDGDTLSVESKDRKTFVVRMMGIDAPEDKQPFAAQSREKLADLILKKRVIVSISKKDSHNRHIGIVYYKGVDVNLRQIKMGMAWHHTPFAFEQRAGDRQEYAAAEQKARAARIGLWEDENPLKPWDFPNAQPTTKLKNENEKQIIAPITTNKADVKADSPTNTKIQTEKKYLRGTRGGCYYINSNGNKTYVDRSLCN